MGCSPSGTSCSSMGLPRGHKSCQQTCSRVGSSLHRSTGPARSLLQCGLPIGSQPSSHTFTCFGMGSSTGYRWISAPLWTSMGCRGTACFTMIFSSGCRGISAPAPGAPTPPPSSQTLVSGEWFLSHILTPLYCCCCAACLFPLFKYVITEALLPSLMGSALASGGSVLEVAGIGSIRNGGSFRQLLTESTPIAPPLPKPCHAIQIR